MKFEVFISAEEIKQAREFIWNLKECPSKIQRKENITDVMVLELMLRPEYWGIRPIIKKVEG